jgi:hypothetical protein
MVVMDDYTQWINEWGSWDPYVPIMSEIDEDIDESPPSPGRTNAH